MASIAGKVAPVFRGDYSPTEVYNFYDAVRNRNKLWFCKRSGTVGIEPLEDSAYWSKGIDGSVGDASSLGGESTEEWNAKISMRNVKSKKLTDVPQVKLPLQEVIEAIETKGKETIESIPDDYTELSNQVDGLKSDLSKGNVGENSIKMTKLEGVKLIENLVDGNFVTGGISADGTITESSTSSNYLWTSQINTEKIARLYRLNNLGASYVGCWKNDGTFITRIVLLASGEYYCDLPKETAYVQIADHKSNVPQTWSRTEQKSFIDYGISKYETSENEYFNNIEKEIKGLNNGDIEENSIKMTKLEGVKLIENLVDGEYIAGSIDKTTGEVKQDDTSANRVWNSVIDSTNITRLFRYVNVGASYVHCYDSDGIHVARIVLLADGETYVDIPNGVTTIRIVDHKSNLPQCWSTTPQSSLVPYGTKEYDLSKNEVLAEKEQLLKGKRWLFMGDSITYGSGATNREKDSYFVKCIRKTGVVGTNIAVGGASLKVRPNADEDTPSVCSLSEITDFSQYDIVTILAGTNDLFILGQYALELETYGIGDKDSILNTTTCGALNEVIENILTSNPNINIFVFTPFYRSRMSNGDGLNSDDNSKNGMYLYDIADKIEETCKKNHVPCKNLYREFMINKYNSETFLADGLHPNDLGHSKLANAICSFVEANFN